VGAKQHLKIARQRRDFLHKTARRYVERYALIAVEDLNVGGLLRNRRVAKASPTRAGPNSSGFSSRRLRAPLFA
jgi:transposase